MSTSMLHEDLIFLNYKTTNFKNLIEELSHILYKKGYVKESYTSAILEREKQFPTGLKTPGINIAMPHTYPEHVIKPAILVATLENPIDFHEMGNSSNTVPAKLIFMLAVTDPKGHLKILSKLMSIFSQEDKLIDLYNSTQAKEIIDKLNKVLN